MEKSREKIRHLLLYESPNLKHIIMIHFAGNESLQD